MLHMLCNYTATYCCTYIFTGPPVCHSAGRVRKMHFFFFLSDGCVGFLPGLIPHTQTYLSVLYSRLTASKQNTQNDPTSLLKLSLPPAPAPIPLSLSVQHLDAIEVNIRGVEHRGRQPKTGGSSCDPDVLIP